MQRSFRIDQKRKIGIAMIRSLIFLGSLFFFSLRILAQEQLEEDELVLIEKTLERSAPSRKSHSSPTFSRKASLLETKNLGELSVLAPFEEVSVIQRRFMPKTSRFELHGGYSYLLNNPFFNVSGFQVKLGYFLSENWGVEAGYRMLTTTDTQDTKDLRNQAISTKNLVTVQSSLSYGINFSPIYGKISWLNHKIIPFDHFFTMAYVITQTQSENVGGFQLGTGQLFSWSKSMAFRWDIYWNSYSATTSPGVASSINDLMISLGVSYFFPEAKYR